MRKEAAKRGLDPDQWFNNVEIVVGGEDRHGDHHVRRNIYKYYVPTSYWWTLASGNRRRANSWRRESRDARSDQSTRRFFHQNMTRKPMKKLP